MVVLGQKRLSRIVVLYSFGRRGPQDLSFRIKSLFPQGGLPSQAALGGTTCLVCVSSAPVWRRTGLEQPQGAKPKRHQSKKPGYFEMPEAVLMYSHLNCIVIGNINCFITYHIHGMPYSRPLTWEPSII